MEKRIFTNLKDKTHRKIIMQIVEIRVNGISIRISAFNSERKIDLNQISVKRSRGC